MDIQVQVQTTSRNMLLLIFLVVASSYKNSVDQANDKVLQTQKQSIHKHKRKQKLSQSKHFLVSDDGGHHYMLHKRTLHKGRTSDPSKKLKKGNDYWFG